MTVWGNGTTSKPAVSDSGKYGAPRPGGRTHAGADFLGYNDLKAIESGTVTFAGLLNSAAGFAVAIDLPQKDEGCIVTVVRMHLQKDSFQVATGATVVAGQVIGRMGDSGNADGSCDHVEIRYWRNGVLVKTVDPEVWIANRLGAPAGVLGSTQTRTAKAFVNARRMPSTHAEISPSLSLKSGTVGSFDGFAHGETVEGNDIWYLGHFSGFWFWSGAFTSQSTAGLALAA